MFHKRLMLTPFQVWARLPGELRIQNAGNLTIRPATTNTTASLVGEVQNRVIDVEGGKVTLGKLAIAAGILIREKPLSSEDTNSPYVLPPNVWLAHFFSLVIAGTRLIDPRPVFATNGGGEGERGLLIGAMHQDGLIAKGIELEHRRFRHFAILTGLPFSARWVL